MHFSRQDVVNRQGFSTSLLCEDWLELSDELQNERMWNAKLRETRDADRSGLLTANKTASTLFKDNERLRQTNEALTADLASRPDPQPSPVVCPVSVCPTWCRYYAECNEEAGSRVPTCAKRKPTSTTPRADAVDTIRVGARRLGTAVIEVDAGSVLLTAGLDMLEEAMEEERTDGSD